MIKEEATEEYKNLIVSLLQCKRDVSNTVNNAHVLKDVEALYQGGENKWGSKSSLINLF